MLEKFISFEIVVSPSLNNLYIMVTRINAVEAMFIIRNRHKRLYVLIAVFGKKSNTELGSVTRRQQESFACIGPVIIPRK